MNSKQRRDNTFRFPFDINTNYFLVLAAVFFILSISKVNEKIFPKISILQLRDKIQKDVNDKLELYNDFLTDTVLTQNLYSNNLSSEQFLKFKKLPFGVFVYKNHELIQWNTVGLLPPKDTFEQNTPTPYKDINGYYITNQIKQNSLQESRSIVALIPIKHDNGISNEYFVKYFEVGDPENDYNIDVSFEKLSDSKPIIIKNKIQFYLYQNSESFSINDKNGWRLFLNAFFFILFGVSIHTYFKVVVTNQKQKTFLIFGLLLLTIFVVRFLTYYFNFPCDFKEFGLFSADYFASDKLNKSLGDLFINECLTFWALLFFLINVQSRTLNIAKLKYKFLLGIFIMILNVVIGLYLSNVVITLIRDSIINFDTTVFYNLDIFSFVGLFAFIIIFVNIIFVNIISHTYLLYCFTNKFIKYICLFILFLCAYKLNFFETQICNKYFFSITTLLFVLLDFNYLKIKFDFNSYKLLIWLIIISVTGSFFLTNLVIDKELINREAFANRLIKSQDPNLEINITDFKKSIETDSMIQDICKQRTNNRIEDLVHYISTNYNDNPTFKKFDVDITLQDVPSQLSSTIIFDIIKFKNSSNSLTPSELVKDNIILIKTYYKKGYNLYINVPISNDSSSILTIELVENLINNRNNSKDIIHNNDHSDNSANHDYSYAIYEDTILSLRQGNYPFRHKLNEKFLAKKVINDFQYSQLWLSNEESNVSIVVVKENNTLYLFTTLFAYIFFILFVVLTLYILGNIIARSNLNYKRFINLLSINLRLRIHFSILVVELLSFLVIGYFTSYFLIKRVEEKNISSISNYGYAIQKEVNELGEDMSLEGALDSAITNPNSRYIKLMKNIANRYSININLFDLKSGKLMFSSEPELKNRGLVSDRINSQALFEIRTKNIDYLILEDEIGSLKYNSSYSYIRNSRNQNIGIVQIPYFLLNNEIRKETTAVIITLINIYVFVFLFSSLIAFVITRSVTRPFTYIVKQFTKINLSKINQPLKWGYSDEIGLLVKEYNRMLRKLENSTVLLAKNERELAWREMAKQVAHEIKTPLTPMKLSLQMLERAIKNNATNVNEIVGRVTNTLIEQIDNLSLIATNFSNFAKMPELKKEEFVLNELLYSVTGMYNDDSNNEFLFLIPEYNITVFADKNQLIRVFTNLIQNAIQSIPENRKGNISMVLTKVKNNFIRISIGDNGEGISEEKGKQLFQPYFTTKSSGTGLGLAMCKDIIEQFDGKISFESIEGEGSTFHVDLPIHDLTE